MNRAPLRRGTALWLVLLMVLLSASASQAQTAFTPTPLVAAASGGSVVRATNIPTIYFSLAATVDGVSAPIFNGGQSSNGYWIVLPPHAPGTATIDVIAMNGTTPVPYRGTITYVDLPQVGLASAVTAVSRGSQDEPSVRRSNNFGSSSSSSSADGRYVVFLSDSGFAGLPGSTTRDVYRKDLTTRALVRVLGCGLDCSPPSMSLDGARVVTRAQSFSSSQVLVVDTPFVAARRVDVDVNGNAPTAGSPESVTMSGNGRFVAFTTSSNLDGNSADGTTTRDLFVRDLAGAELERWTTGIDLVASLHMDASGRYIVFSTNVALSVVDGNGFNDVYILDRETGTFTNLTAGATAPSFAPIISADGSTVVFSSAASNLVDGDTNGVSDAFLKDLRTGTVERASLTSSGAQLSTASSGGSISANGRRIIFTSTAPELTSGPLPERSGGVILRDRTTGQTVLVNSDVNGFVSAPAFQSAFGGTIAPDGRGVTFNALAQNLVANDTNGTSDVFRKELPANTSAGTNVPAVPVDPATGETPVALVFDSVTEPFDTFVTYTDTAPDLPAGFQVGSRFVDITTTLSPTGAPLYTGSVTVCVEYDPATTPDPSVLQLLHYEGGAWVNITTSLDTIAHVVCGRTTSLSPFVLAIPPQVTYTVRSLLDEGRVFKAGSTIPIRVQILEGGANVSAADLPLVATGVRLVSTQTDWAVPEDPGQSNPDLGFQFTDVEGEPGYRFNLKTTGLVAGTYELQFRVGTDGPTLTVTFQVR